jgi:hypothetical protein
VSRKVVGKVIRSGATEFRYERGKQPLPRIDPWRGQLDGLLLANEGKASGCYDAVRRYAKKRRVERGAATAEAFVPLSFAPGEVYQFDGLHFDNNKYSVSSRAVGRQSGSRLEPVLGPADGRTVGRS